MNRSLLNRCRGRVARSWQTRTGYSIERKWLLEPFPFTDAEWEPVETTALALANAAVADDEVLRASLRVEIVDLLNRLRERHGEHPFLLELIADYTEDEADRVTLYRRAAEIAVTHDLPTFTLRLSLARLLLELNEPARAVAELRACEASIHSRSESERTEWLNLFEEAEWQTNRTGTDL